MSDQSEPGGRHRRKPTANADVGTVEDGTDRFEVWSCDDCGISFGYPCDIVPDPWKCPKCGSEEVQRDGE